MFSVNKELFLNWLTGIFEDDPIDYEIKYISIIIELKNNDLYLSLFGQENIYNKRLENTDNYYPLEAQYYSDNNLRRLINNGFTKKKLILLVSNNLMQIIKEEKKFIKDLHDKTILIGTINSKYLYKI